MYCTVHSQLYTHTCSLLLSFLPSRVFSVSSSPPLLLSSSPPGAGDEKGSCEDRTDAARVHAAGGEDCLESSRGQALEVSEMGRSEMGRSEMGRSEMGRSEMRRAMNGEMPCSTLAPSMHRSHDIRFLTPYSSSLPPFIFSPQSRPSPSHRLIGWGQIRRGNTVNIN